MFPALRRDHAGCGTPPADAYGPVDNGAGGA